MDLLDGLCALRRVRAGCPRRCMGAWCKAGGRAFQHQWLRNGQACRSTALLSWEVLPAGAALEQLDQFTPEHLSRLLWAYSTLRIYSPELYSAVRSVATLLQAGTSRLIRPGSVLRQLIDIESGTCARPWCCHHPCLRLTAVQSCTGAAGTPMSVQHVR